MEIFFSSNLKKLRSDYNVSQEELGKAINYSSKNISKWETEKAIPSIEIIKAISEFFENIPIEDLMYKNLGLNEFNTIKDVEYAKQTLIDFGPECINFLYDLYELNIDAHVLTMDFSTIQMRHSLNLLNSARNGDYESLINILSSFQENNLLDKYFLDYSENTFIVKLFFSFSPNAFNIIKFDLETFVKRVKSYYLEDVLSENEYIFLKNNCKLPKQSKFILSLIEKIPFREFSLSDVYVYIEDFKQNYPKSKSIKNSFRKAILQLQEEGFIRKTNKLGVYFKRYINSLNLLENLEVYNNIERSLTGVLFKNQKSNDLNNTKEFIIDVNLLKEFNIFSEFNYQNINLIESDYSSLILLIDRVLKKLIEKGILRYGDLTISNMYIDANLGELICTYANLEINHIILNYAFM